MLKGKGHPRFYEILEKQADLHSKKNADYTGDDPSKPLGNFVRVSQIMQLYPGTKWYEPVGNCLVQLLKQLDAALIMLSRDHKSLVGEPVPSRLNDIAVLANLGQILLMEEDQENVTFDKHSFITNSPFTCCQVFYDGDNLKKSNEPTHSCCKDCGHCREIGCVWYDPDFHRVT